MAAGWDNNYSSMSKLAKILVTIVVLMVFFLLFGAVVGSRSASGHQTPGLIGLILFSAVIYAVRAIWKSGSNDDRGNDNGSILQQ